VEDESFPADVPTSPSAAMNHRTTVVLLILFFTGLIVLWWADVAGIPTAKQRRQMAGRVLPALVDTPFADVRRVEIFRDGARIDLNRRGGGRWQMTEPVDAAADPSRVEELVRILKDLSMVPDSGKIAGSMWEYGLGQEAVTVRVSGTHLRTPLAELKVGDTVGDLRYVQPVGESGIEVVAARLLAALDVPANDWRDRAMFRLPTFQVASLAVTGPGRDLKATRDREEGLWRLIRPYRTPADEAKMEGVLADLGAIVVADGAEGFVANDVRDFTLYGLDTPAMTIELAPLPDSGAPQTLFVGKEVPDRADRLYARRGDQDDVVWIDAQSLRDIGMTPGALRGRRVADIQPAAVDSLSIEALGRVFELARMPSGWDLVQPSRGKADPEAVQALILGLVQLQASVFLDEGKVDEPRLKPPSLTVRAWQGPPRAGSSAGATKGDLRLDLGIGRHDLLKKTVYARLVGDRTILGLPDSILDVLPKNPLSYRDRTIVAVDPGRVNRLTVARGEGTYTLVAAEAPGQSPRWRMSAPVEGPGDDESVAKVLGMLAPLRAERLVAEEIGDGKAFGLDAPGLSLTWSSRPEGGGGRGESSGGPQTLRISLKGPTADTFYADVIGNPLVFTVGGPQIQPLLAEFRDHRVLTFPAAKVTRLVLRRPGQTLSLARDAGPAAGPSTWRRQPGSEGIRFDLSRLDALVTSLADLSVPRFTQYAGPFPESAGLHPPRLTIEVEVAGEPGKRLLRVGNAGADGAHFATAAPGDEGPVFLLAGTGWAELVKAPGGAGELPENVFAP